MGAIAILASIAPNLTRPLNNDIITSHHAMKMKVPIGNNSSAVFRLYLVEQPLGIVNSLFLALFCIKYTTAAAKKRRPLLYFAIELLTEPYNTSIAIVTDKTKVETALLHIDSVYKQIKKNVWSSEERPGI